MAKKKKKDYWVIKITLVAFLISFVFSGLSETLIPKINLFISVFILFMFIILGIIFDMIGVSITTCNESSFHAKSARKIKSAKVAIKLLRNASKVSSFCNDVVGDVAGILSGSAGVMIAATIINKTSFNPFIISLTVTALIASLTIGGKALGKDIAIKNNEKIVFAFAEILSVFYK